MRFTFAKAIKGTTNPHLHPQLSSAAPAEVAADVRNEVSTPSGRAAPPSIDQPLLSPDKESILLEAMKAAFPRGRLGCDDWQPIVDAELRKRQYWFKYRYIPWLNSVLPLNGTGILEIGAGTGCATIPLLESGARATSIDISEPDLKIAALRAKLHGVADRCSFKQINAAEIGRIFSGWSFDLIVYFAALEHMTYQERLASLRAAWSLLSSGQILAVCDTPNRLWYYDEHTSLNNFFHWLPDEIAVDYAARTPRQKFNIDFSAHDANSTVRLHRWGRGISYHEFEIAFGLSVCDLDVHGEWQYRREHNDPQWWTDVWSNSKDGQFHTFLRSIEPRLPIAFTEPELALAIRKP